MKNFKISTPLLLLFSFFSSLISAEELRNLLPEQLISLQKNNNALVIDIRTEREWAETGIIPASHKLQFFAADGTFNTDQWLLELNQLKSTEDQAIILVCRSGNRSGKLGNLLTKKLGIKNVYHLSSGLSHWIKQEHKVMKECTPQLACQ